MPKKSERMVTIEKKMVEIANHIGKAEMKIGRIKEFIADLDAGKKTRDESLKRVQAEIVELRNAYRAEREALEIATIEHLASDEYSDKEPTPAAS